MQSYPVLAIRVVTPRLELHAASDDLLDRLAPVVRAGKAAASPPPYDDPMSLYEPDPDARVSSWLRGVWRGRGIVNQDFWRLYFVVLIDGVPVGMQDLIGDHFTTFKAVTTFSWLSTDVRRRGIGREMRQAALHLAFAGLGAREATSDAFTDNQSSNGVSQALGYETNGLTWATRQDEPAQLQRWRLTREKWQEIRRVDIDLHGVEAALSCLGLDHS